VHVHMYIHLKESTYFIYSFKEENAVLLSESLVAAASKGETSCFLEKRECVCSRWRAGDCVGGRVQESERASKREGVCVCLLVYVLVREKACKRERKTESERERHNLPNKLQHASCSTTHCNTQIAAARIATQKLQHNTLQHASCITTHCLNVKLHGNDHIEIC